MTDYIAFLRGINVGGKNLISMKTLCEVLSEAGFENVRSYIQSGNVFFSSSNANQAGLAAQIKQSIQKKFTLAVEVVVFSEVEWRGIIEAAPAWWGKDSEWKHNILILMKPTSMSDVMAAIGEPKLDIEQMQAGKRVVYQSVSFKLFGRTTASRLVGKPIYKDITIRNYNTATKLAALLRLT